MKYELDIELALLLTPNTFAIVVNQETNNHELIVIRDGKQIDRRPVLDFGFDVKIEMNPETFYPEAVVTLNGVEMFRSVDSSNWTFDGDIITLNQTRTVEQAIKDFEEIAHTTIRVDDKITFILD